MDPAVARSTFEGAIGLHRQGRTAEAEQLYRQVLIWAPSQFPVQYMLAVACHQQQKWLEALAAIDAALVLDPLSVDAQMLRGTLLLQNQCNEQALVVFTALSERTPNRADVWHSVGAVLGRLARHEEAVAAFDKALGQKQTAESWNDRGVALQRINRLQEAANSFDQALAFRPDVRFAYNRACALLQLRCFDEALAAFDAVLTQDPSSFDAWNDRGAALEGLGRDEAALASYDHALTMRPEFAQAWYNRGGVLYRLSRFADAVSSYDKLLAITPGHIDGWKNCGAALHKLGDFELAIDCYRRVTELRPDDIVAWNEVASLLQFQQRYKDALEYSDQTLALQRDYPPALRTRSLILWESGCIAEGMAVARRHAELIQATLPAFFEEDPPHKTRHDAEQADYLAGQGVRVASSILHIVGGERLEGSAINHGDTAATITQWRNNHPQVVVIDDFLAPEALAALREFTWGSTIWRKPYKNGYLGAMPEHGFSCPLLAQIAEELCAKFPDIFHGHGLAMLWGFKYDSKLGGIRIHADQAAVNVNFWITPNEANRNPDSGGLLIWDQAAPPDWNITRYNGDDEAVRTFLAKTCSKPIKIPYRANRAVIFDSDLFHETDKIEFEEGYLNRRINITMLFGRRTPRGF